MSHLNDPFPTEKDLSAYSEHEALLQALNLSLAIIEFDLNGVVVNVNQNYLDYFGYQRDEVIGQSHKMFCKPDFIGSKEYHALRKSLRAGQSLEGRFERRHKDGSPVWLAAIYQPVPGRDGKTAKMVKIAKNITQQVALESSTHEWVQLLTELTDRSDSAMFIAGGSDDGQLTLYINQGFTKLFGYSAQQALGQPIAALLQNKPPSSSISASSDDLHQTLQPEELFYSQDGQPHWCSATINSVYDEQGKASYTIGVLTDITPTKIYEVLQYKVLESLVLERPLDEVLNMFCLEIERIAPEVVVSILQARDDNTLQHLAAPSLSPHYTDALQRVPIGPHSGSCGTAAYRKEPVLVDDIANDPLCRRLRHILLPLGLLACWSSPILSSQGEVLGTFAFYFREKRGPNAFHHKLVKLSTNLCALALERKQSRMKIQQLALYDSLTGLPNRAQFLNHAHQAISQAEAQGQSLVVLVIDIDRFKQVNDSLGQAAGDELLCTIAQRLRGDMAKHDIIGRLSGDEFVLILTSFDVDKTTLRVEKLLGCLSQPCQIAGVTIIPSAGIGISLYPDNGKEINTLLHNADAAKHKAKEMGRGQFQFFSREMNQLNLQRQALEGALRQAVHLNTLQLYYQPQVRLHDSQLYGVEALSRWHHPTLGEIPPQRFIPLAEECGLINELALWTINEACRQLAEWRLRGLDVPSISVNLSPTNFHNLGLPDIIAHILQRYHLPPQDLTLEITEDILIDNNPSIFATLHKIHKQGVRLSMDDFGTGYSSLSYLRRLELDEIKLDKSFVNDLEHDETSRTLSEAVIRIGESLQLSVVVEGVETEAQRNLLSRQGYLIGQGYLFSEPLDASAMEQWVIAHASS
ncbi:diguanylate phosphodiesterase [Yersinia entomophaga]|uniref:Diguanylate phosphodiesterase n=1 Tax=Yersinia entomophaga TaxID=935293 RepID=A0ABN4PUC5_YERET|nr:EAL domain-containing protein [Yersinia entomophaga]ANI29129.1 diguanylate phosphodiesterase [Yersinia entomophaga]OWF87493.1 GGDEF domain-containing protein [Yersinia entomophaga]